MSNTSLTLLELIKQDDDPLAWQRMVNLYHPLLIQWIKRLGGREEDADDLAQEVLLIVTKKLSEFEHAGRVGAFRSWLKNIARNCLLKFWREKKGQLAGTGATEFQHHLNQLADDTSPLSQLWNQEYEEFVLASVLKHIQPEFQSQTWMIFQRVAMAGETPNEVAEDLGVTTNTIFIAKSRVMARLRLAGKHLLEDI